MNTLLDTNIFYTYSQLENPVLNIEKLRKELLQFDDIYLSELTLLEMITKYQEKHNKIIDAINFIADTKIKVKPVFDEDETIVSKLNDIRMLEPDYFRNILNEAIHKKIKIEADFFTSWCASVSSILLMFLFRKKGNTTIEQRSRIISQFDYMVTAIKSEDGYFQNKIYSDLEYFYTINKKELNGSINSLFLEVVESFNIVFEAGLHDIVLLKEVYNHSLYPDNIIDLIKKSEMAQKISKKHDGEKIAIIDNNDKEILEDTIESFIEKVSANINNKILIYQIKVYKNYLTMPNFKIKKNDIFDSIFLRYLDDFALLTLDKGLRTAIGIINSEKYQVNENLIQKCV